MRSLHSTSQRAVPMESEDVYDVCIVGAGIGGLATALALQQQGLQRILIVERDGHFFDRKQGYGLTLTNSLTGPLAKLGLLDDCIEKNCKSQSHYTFNASGEVLGYYGRVLDNATTTSTSAVDAHHHSQQGGNRGNLRVPRQDLRQLMLSRLSPNQVKLCWGQRLIDFEEQADGVTLTFVPSISDSISNKITRRAYVLLGADGLRSRVRELRDEKLQLAERQLQSPLRYLGVSVMIGIAPIDHPLLCDKGFYVLDGQNRVFIMPYFTPGANDDYHVAQKCQPITPVSASGVHPVLSQALADPKANAEHDKPHLLFHTAGAFAAMTAVTERSPYVMWQLSYPQPDEAQALALKNSSFETILQAARDRVAHMFPAVHTLIENTIHSGEIWSTPLYDRNDLAMHARGCGTRVTMLGDAAHPMCMFKGQGANMALEDAPLFAAYICTGQSHARINNKRQRSQDLSISLRDVPKDVLLTRIRNFEREMVARCSPKVQGSRKAAAFYHSEEALHEEIGLGGLDEVVRSVASKNGEAPPKEWVQQQAHILLPAVLQSLKDKRVNAALGETLDTEFRRAVCDTVLEHLNSI